MDLIAVITYISLLAVVVVLTTIDSNASTSCNDHNIFNGPNSCNSCIGCNGHHSMNGFDSCNYIHFSIGSSSCIDFNWL